MRSSIIFFTPLLVALLASAAPLEQKRGPVVALTRSPVHKTAIETRAAKAPAACEAKKRSLNDGSHRRSRVRAVSLAKRIAQSDLPAVAQSWQDLCLKSGGDLTTNDPCVTLAGDKGIAGLLANSAPCAQQDNADAMVTFAKSKGVTNKEALIANAVAYREHPRNALNINGVTPSTVFCDKAPENEELAGKVNKQLNGVDPGLFGAPNIAFFAFGGPGSCPFGETADVDTCTCK